MIKSSVNRSVAVVCGSFAVSLLIGCAHLRPDPSTGGNEEGTIPFPKDATLGLVFSSNGIQVFDSEGRPAPEVKETVDVRQLEAIRALLFLKGSCIVTIPTPTGYKPFKISDGPCPPGIVGGG